MNPVWRNIINNKYARARAPEREEESIVLIHVISIIYIIYIIFIDNDTRIFTI